MDWSKTRVLLVHSDISVRRWAHDVFHKQKVAGVQSTRSPATGFDLLNRFDADVAVVQLGHTEFSGADFARQIRQSDRSPNAELPIVLIVDTPNPDLLKVACEAGIEGMVTRPTKPDVFLERISKAVLEGRRFVSTESYFGPNRRGESAADFDGPDRRIVDLTIPPSKRKDGIEGRSRPKPAVASSARKPIGQWEGDLAPATAPAEADKKKKREWKEELVPALAKATGKSEKILPSDAIAESKPTPRHDDDAWAEAIAPEETPEATEPEFQIGPLIEEHMAWLKSRGAEGRKIDLTGADLAGQSLADSDLTNARLRQADLSDSDCRNAVLASADLRRADLSSADLTGADLSVANLRGATLKKAKLADASLRGADLAGASFAGATIAKTDFSSAIMLDTDLNDADLSQAIGLNQKQLDKARLNAGTKLPANVRRPAGD